MTHTADIIYWLLKNKLNVDELNQFVKASYRRQNVNVRLLTDTPAQGAKYYREKKTIL